VSAAAADDDRPPHVGRAMLKRFLLAGVIITLLSAATVASAVLLEVGQAVQIFKRETIPLDPQVKELLAGVKPGKPQTILVIGDDRRRAEALRKHPPPTRSDTMMLVRLDPNKRATAVMSLPRDLLVDIPGHGVDKLNAAFAIGEDRLTLRTVRNLVGIPIHHYVRVTFWGFKDAVDSLGCVYTDVDRHYFNDNRPPFGGGDPYAVIDVKAGYQRLCGNKALDYVRYRHLDSDLVRAARQQAFIGEAKNQIGLSSVFDNRRRLLRIFGRSVRTDIDSTHAILSLLKLVATSAAKPVQQIPFPAQDAPDGSGNVEISPFALHRTVRRFLAARGPRAASGVTRATASSRRAARRASRRRQGRHAGKRSAVVPGGLRSSFVAGRRVGRRLQRRLSQLPVFYPTLLSRGGHYRGDSRAYTILDRHGARYRAYRMVAFEGGIGQYYGVEGTTWAAPPILDNPTRSVTARGRTYELFFDGRRLRMVAWHTTRGTYWVSNTLLRTLSNRQMLAIAESARQVLRRQGRAHR
jgi:polyisoprenyl-teichoic acid--peptidoglycan teichoic acid transferase